MPSNQNRTLRLVFAASATFTVLFAFYYFSHSRWYVEPPPSRAPFGSRVPYQGVSPVWDIGPLKEVAMRFEPSVHYQLNSSEADEEWAALFPNNGIVRLGDNGSQPYMLSMFHQLQCLDILRRTYAKADEPDALTAHCLNYLRQMVLCRRSLRMEPVVAIDNAHSVMLWNHMRCLDWRQVYKAARESD